jgi:hypothetical protein
MHQDVFGKFGDYVDPSGAAGGCCITCAPFEADFVSSVEVKCFVVEWLTVTMNPDTGNLQACVALPSYGMDIIDNIRCSQKVRLRLNGIFYDQVEAAIIPYASLESTKDKTLWVQLGPTLASSPISFKVSWRRYILRSSPIQNGLDSALKLITTTPTFRCCNGLPARLGGIRSLQPLRDSEKVSHRSLGFCLRCHCSIEDNGDCVSCHDNVLCLCGCGKWLPAADEQCSICLLWHDCGTKPNVVECSNVLPENIVNIVSQYWAPCR